MTVYLYNQKNNYFSVFRDVTVIFWRKLHIEISETCSRGSKNW